jgi:hypothetical protein
MCFEEEVWGKRHTASAIGRRSQLMIRTERCRTDNYSPPSPSKTSRHQEIAAIACGKPTVEIRSSRV